MTDTKLYQIETEDGEVLQRGLTMREAEFALCTEINRGAEDACIADDEGETPLGGRAEKNPEHCRCETNYDLPDCGCAFGQCEKGLIY